MGRQSTRRWSFHLFNQPVTIVLRFSFFFKFLLTRLSQVVRLGKVVKNPFVTKVWLVGRVDTTKKYFFLFQAGAEMTLWFHTNCLMANMKKVCILYFCLLPPLILIPTGQSQKISNNPDWRHRRALRALGGRPGSPVWLFFFFLWASNCVVFFFLYRSRMFSWILESSWPTRLLPSKRPSKSPQIV